MSTGQVIPPVGAAPSPEPNGQHLMLTGMSWRFYETFLAELGDRPIHLTYDRGNLEIMTLSYGHERYKRRIGRLVEALTEELNVPLVSAGSMTIKREDLDRGFEPDECYYIANQVRIAGKDELDFTLDPPPDLAIEIDISRSSLDRMGIYAAFRVPEVWRFDGQDLYVYRLKEDGTYEQSPESPGFPFLPLAEFSRFLLMTPGTDETTLIRSFRAWVRQRILPSLQGPTDGTPQPS